MSVFFLEVTGAERGLLGDVVRICPDPLFVVIIDIRASSSIICRDWRALYKIVEYVECPSSSKCASRYTLSRD